MGVCGSRSSKDGDTAVRQPLADLIERDANEGDTRLLVTDFLCEGLGFDKYEPLTTEYQLRESSRTMEPVGI